MRRRAVGQVTAVLLGLVLLGGCAKDAGVDLTLVADATLDAATLAAMRTLDLWSLGSSLSACKSYALPSGFGGSQGEERVRFRAAPRSDSLVFHVFATDAARDVKAYGTGAVTLQPGQTGVLRVTLRAVERQKNTFAGGACSRVDTLREAMPDAGVPDAGTSLLPSLNTPTGLATGGVGKLYVTDTGHHVLRQIDLAETVVVAPRIVAGELDLPGANDTSNAAVLPAHFNTPWGLAYDDARQRLFVADRDNHTIRQISLPDFTVGTLAGSAGQSGSADGVGGAARFNAPTGLAYAPDGGGQGYLYVADSQNHLVRQIALDTGTVTRLAGVPGVSGDADGPGESAQFSTPASLAHDGTRNVLYVADSGNRRIRQIALAGMNPGEVITLAPSSCQGSTTDPLCFRIPDGLAYDRAGDALYVADTDLDQGTHAIRRLAPATCPRCQVITVMGQRETVLAGDLVPLPLAPLRAPSGLLLLSPSTLVVTSGADMTSKIQIVQGLIAP